MNPLLDFKPQTDKVGKALFGNWQITFPNGDSVIADQRSCLDEAKRKGFERRSIEWTEAARKEGFRAYFAQYRRR